MRKGLGTLSHVAMPVLLTITLLTHTSLALSRELPDTVPVVEALKSLSTMIDETEKNTKKFLVEGRIPKGECEGLYKGPPAGYYLIRNDAIEKFQLLSTELTKLLAAIKPITDVDQEVRERKAYLDSLHSPIQAAIQTQKQLYDSIEKLKAEKEGEQQDLKAIRGDQKVAVSAWLFRNQTEQKEVVSNWLLRNYGGKVPEPTITVDGKRVMVISNVLFGTFFSEYPLELSPDEASQTKVIFKPANFSGELFGKGIQIGPGQQYSRPIPQGLLFNPSTVEGERFTGPFQIGERQTVAFKREVTWTWQTEASEQFRGAKFDIYMQAAAVDLRNASGVPGTVARLPISIRRRPEPGWWEWLGNWLGPILGCIVGVLFNEGFHRLAKYYALRREQRARRIVPPRS